jgi:hypothetical protein
MNDFGTHLLEQLGGVPDEVATDLRKFSQTARVLSDEQENLIDNHPLQWVGIYEGRVSASSRTLTSLMASLESQGIPANKTIVRFIEKNQSTLIL